MFFMLLLLTPASALAYGGGGGGGGGGNGGGEGGFGFDGMSTMDMGFFDPSSTGGMDIAGGTIDLNNLPEVQLTPQQQLELEAQIARMDAAFWNVGTPIVEGLAFAGQAAGWVLAFTPAGLPVKIAISTTRGAADGYAASVERGDGKEAAQAAFSGTVGGLVEGATRDLNPALGILAGTLAGELANNAGNNASANRAPGYNIGDMAMDQARVTHDPYTGRQFNSPVYK